MGILEDIGQGFADIPKVIGNSAAGKFLGDAGNYIGKTFSNDFQHPWAMPGTSGNGGGSADIGSTPSDGPPVGSTLPAGWQGTQQPGIAQTMMDSFVHQANSPAMDPALVQQTMQSLQGVKLPDYLQQSKDAYNNVLNQLHGISDNVNSRYDQVGQNVGDIYNTDQNAMTMGANNILTKLAQGEGDAIQGGAQNNMAALANLKNAELAQRAAVAQKGGVAMAAGDMKTDPADVAATGTLANAQQSAENARAAATQQTNMNNEMASALGNQNAMMQAQLGNNRLSYNASMGKYQADLANQEATREIEAQKQMYQDALARTQAMYGISKDQASLNIQKNQALYGNKGFLGDGLTAAGTYGLDQAKANQAMQAAGASNVAPDVTALQAYPQFQQEYLKAMQNMQLTPGAKPTAQDLIQYGLKDMQGQSPDQLQQWAQFAQMASSPKALSDPNLDTYLALQNQ